MPSRCCIVGLVGASGPRFTCTKLGRSELGGLGRPGRGVLFEKEYLRLLLGFKTLLHEDLLCKLGGPLSVP